MTDDVFIVPCPHCNGLVQISKKEINCNVFIHGYDIARKAQINPHASEDECKTLRENPNIHGCVKPFRVLSDDHLHWKAEPEKYG